MTIQQQEMIEYTTQEVIQFIIEDNNVTMDEAMDLFYMSKTFDLLNDTETGLYLEGALYIFDMFIQEKQRG